MLIPPARHPRAPILLLAALLTLAGCAVGPDYRPPEIEPPDAWHQQLVRGLTSGDASLETWWTVFEDPVLTDLVGRAGSANLTLRQAFERIAAAAGRRGIAVGEWFPRVDGDAFYDRSQLSEEALRIPLPGIADPFDIYSLGLGAGWEIDLFGRIRRSVEAADADLAASVEDYRDTLVVLYAEMAASYVDVRTFQERIRYAEKNVASQRDTLELVRTRNRTGLVGDLDVAQAEQNVARTASLIPQLRQGMIFAMNRIAVLAGEYPSELRSLLAGAGEIPRSAPDVAVGIPAELLRQRPDVRSAERQLAAQTARIGVATADLYPRLALLGTLSLSARDASNLFTGGAGGFSFGPQLGWNIFDGGRIRSNVRAQEALTREVLAGYEQTVLEAVEDVENALTAYAEERSRVAELRRSADAATRAVELVKVLYRTGLTDFMPVLDSERVQFEEQDRLIESEGQVTKNLIGIYRALGGGWTP